MLVYQRVYDVKVHDWDRGLNMLYVCNHVGIYFGIVTDGLLLETYPPSNLSSLARWSWSEVSLRSPCGNSVLFSLAGIDGLLPFELMIKAGSFKEMR